MVRALSRKDALKIILYKKSVWTFQPKLRKAPGRTEQLDVLICWDIYMYILHVDLEEKRTCKRFYFQQSS